MQNAKDILRTKYFDGVQNTFLLGNRKGKLPNPALPSKLKKFYNCVACIMSDHLQSLCVLSLEEYTYFLHDIWVNLSGIKMSNVLVNITIFSTQIVDSKSI